MVKKNIGRRRGDEGFEPVKAYKDLDFLKSRAGRPLRIMAEFVEPEDRFERYDISDTIVFFGSARTLSREQAERALVTVQKGEGDIAQAEIDLEMSRFYEDARGLSFRMTEWSKNLGGNAKRFVVCTGGGPGIMEAANRGAAEAKGNNIGLNISLPFEQHQNPYITHELAFDFHYFFMRKFWFSYLAKAFIVFPGGYGTLDEFFELLTLVSTKKMGKPLPIILYGKSYWNDVLNLKVMLKYGMISSRDLKLFKTVDTIDEAFEYLTQELSKHHIDKPGGCM